MSVLGVFNGNFQIKCYFTIENKQKKSFQCHMMNKNSLGMYTL